MALPGPAVSTQRWRSGLLVAGAVLALIGTVLADVVDRVRLLASGTATLGWAFDVENRYDVYIEGLLGSFVAVAVVAGSAVLAVRPGRRRWAGAGLLVGLGLFAVGPAVFQLGGGAATTGFGYAVTVVGGALAFAAVLRAEPGPGTPRPGWSAALIALGVAAALLYLVLRFSHDAGGVAVFWFLWTAAVIVGLPVWAVRARPAYLGIGLVGAVLAVVAPTFLDLSLVFRQWGPLQALAWLVFCLLGVAMAVVAVVALRVNREESR